MSVWQILIVLFLFLVNVLPWVLALASKKVEGTQKFIWFCASFFLSWLGYFVYYFVVIKKQNTSSTEVRNAT